jgi:acyl-coenzyme A synthetase/AMP-(fatty) acid ligase
MKVLQSMQPSSRRSLWDLAAPQHSSPERFFADAQDRVAVRDLAGGTSLDIDPEALRGQSVMISTGSQLLTALAVAELDGIARRLLLCTPDLVSSHVTSAMTDAMIDTVISDGTGPFREVDHPGTRVIPISARIRDAHIPGERNLETEWVLFTSGTTGRPKLAMHTLSSLTGPLGDGTAAGDAVWSTFYDIRRYGGLQILLRALAGGSSMVLSSAGEPVGDFLARAGASGITHISGTPSHWRRALMSAAAERISPGYVRLSGEACDQTILDSLRRTYPHAEIAHAFASTEAGVAFDVRDGLAGFPASLVGETGRGVQMRVEDGSLRIRSSRTAARYLGEQAPALSDEAGFVDTGDLVELRGERFYFIGRRSGIINVGGLKVHPEAVEAVINQHPAVHMSRVSARRSPITGAIVVGEIVVNVPDSVRDTPFETISGEVMDLCRTALPSHQVPAMLREVPFLEISPSGKLVRRHA